GRRQLLLAPHRLQESIDPAVVLAARKSWSRRGFGERVVCPGAPLGLPVFGELVQGVGPVMAVNEIKIRVARVIRNRSPVLRICHSMDDCAVTSGRLAEAARVVA